MSIKIAGALTPQYFVKKMLPAPNPDATPDLSAIVPELATEHTDGVNSLQSTMVLDKDICTMLFNPTMSACKDAAMSQAITEGEADNIKRDIELAQALGEKHTKGELSKEELVQNGMVAVNHMVALRLDLISNHF